MTNINANPHDMNEANSSKSDITILLKEIADSRIRTLIYASFL